MKHVVYWRYRLWDFCFSDSVEAVVYSNGKIVFGKAYARKSDMESEFLFFWPDTEFVQTDFFDVGKL